MTATPDTQAKVSADQNARIELRNVKHAAFASEETECFTAAVYIDGKKEGDVANEGHGGSNYYRPHTLETKLKEIADAMPALDISSFYADGETHTMRPCADTVIGDLLNEHLQRKHLKKLCAKHTLFRIEGQTYLKGEYHTYKVKFTPLAKATLLAKYPNATILNETL